MRVLRATALPALVLLLAAAALPRPASAAGQLGRKAYKEYQDGLKAAERGRWEEARSHLVAALKEDPEDGRRMSGMRPVEYFPRLALANAYIELGDPEAAGRMLDELAGADLGSAQQAEMDALRRRLAETGGGDGGDAAGPAATGPSELARLAQEALAGGRLAEARSLAVRALGTDPNDAAAAAVLAQVDAQLAGRITDADAKRRQGDLDGAEQVLTGVLAIDAASASATTLLQAVREDRRRAEDDLERASEALRREDPDDAERLARAAGARDRALARRVDALVRDADELRDRLRGPSAEELLARARAALGAGRLDEARSAARKAASAGGGDRAASIVRDADRQEREAAEALARARAALDAGDTERAREEARDALRRDAAVRREAQRIMARADREPTVDASSLVARIDEALVERDVADAARTLAELEDSVPDHPEIGALRARIELAGEIVAGFRSFFSGEIDASIRALERAREGRPPRADVLVVLASALATRGLLADGEDGERDMAKARTAFAQALDAHPGLELDAGYFSPRVIAIFDEVERSRR